MSRSLLIKLFPLIIALPLHSTANASLLAGEINHLITFVGNSDCTFIRNGDNHNADEAVAHMQKKYDYFRKKIDSTEEFIEMSASKSLLSGEPYWIACPGSEKQHSRTWLLNALALYRLNKSRLNNNPDS